MPAIVTLKKTELVKRPGLLADVKPFVSSISETEDTVMLELKTGYLTLLTATISKKKLSYEIIYQDLRFTQDELCRVLARHC